MSEPRVVHDFTGLDPAHCWWVPATAAPVRDWRAAPGCHRGARYLVAADSHRPVATGFPAFENRADCLRWIMANRLDFARTLPGARVDAVALDRWMLGMEAV